MKLKFTNKKVFDNFLKELKEYQMEKPMSWDVPYFLLDGEYIVTPNVEVAAIITELKLIEKYKPTVEI